MDSLLISLWILFHHSPKKTAAFKEIQKKVYSIDVLKVLKVSTTRWLSLLDSLFIEVHEPELKGLWEQLLDLKIILTTLFLTDILGKVVVLNLWLQPSDIQFSLSE